MNTLIQANIFFFITTIAVIIFAVLGSVALYYLIRILKNIHRASEILEGSFDRMSNHADDLYQAIRQSVLFNLVFRKKTKK